MISPRALFVAQRYSAMLLAPMVLVHLLVIVLAVRNGLSADEILGRTRGNAFWFWFYLLFVLAVTCLLYTSPSPRDGLLSRMPSSA